jgi:SAM-dependent methyltransferase
MSDVGPPPPASFPLVGDGGTDAVRYGPLVADERELRLLANVSGRRLLLLGTGAGQAAVCLAAGGARVIAVDPDEASVAATRARCAADGYSVDVRSAGLSELAFVRADTIDVALSVFALTEVADLARVFRQVHRVLRPDAPIVLSLPHPLLHVVSDGPDGPTVTGGYGASTPTPWTWDGHRGRDHHHTIEAVTMALVRAAFRPDALHELRPAAANRARPVGPDRWWQPGLAQLPAVLVVRARKVGL